MPNGTGENKILRGIAGGGLIEVVDVGDIEIIKVGDTNILAVLPVGKAVYLLGRHGLFKHALEVSQLKEMT